MPLPYRNKVHMGLQNFCMNSVVADSVVHDVLSCALVLLIYTTPTALL